MRNSAKALRTPILIMWSVILAAFTAILGAAPLKALRTSVGHGPFWFLGLALSAGCWWVGWLPLAMVIGAQVILVGTYSEFEERDFSIRQSSALAVLLTALLFSSGFYFWTAVKGKNWMAVLVNAIDGFLSQAASLKITFMSELKAQDIVMQLPSALLIFLIFSIAAALIFERPTSQWASVNVSRREKLSGFSAPDFLIWLFIVSLLGAFAQTGIKALEIISINVLNICGVIYFFQGLAVLCKYFEVFSVTFFWRFAWVILLVIQLPMILGLLGLVDYWADFRKMFVKRAANLKKKSVQD